MSEPVWMMGERCTLHFRDCHLDLRQIGSRRRHFHEGHKLDCVRTIERCDTVLEWASFCIYVVNHLYSYFMSGMPLLAPGTPFRFGSLGKRTKRKEGRSLATVSPQKKLFAGEESVNDGWSKQVRISHFPLPTRHFHGDSEAPGYWKKRVTMERWVKGLAKSELLLFISYLVMKTRDLLISPFLLPWDPCWEHKCILMRRYLPYTS